ncbi:thioredoxin domain-containing protein [Lysobacter sp. F6437]|uniref:thioredoxin domain-containing protein n=1 Tax=Lysobacter sp. F6437 TaxID=3459296 RepID=UPI00403E0877
MLYRLGLTLAAALALAACSQEAPAPANPGSTTAPASNASTPTNAPAASGATARTPGAVVPPVGAAPVAGTDYVVIPGGTPFKAGNDKIEVVEVFGYTCPHCATFEPLVSAWSTGLPADVEFVPMAAPFGGYWMPYAKAFFTAQAMGVAAQSHEAVFRAIHVDRSLPVQPLPTDEQLGQFYAQFGVDPKQFTSTMSSFAINAKLSQARQFIERSFVNDTPSTPTLIINGKYRIKTAAFDEQLRIADHLIAMERAAMPADAAPAAGAGE